nr:VIT1/CCC1 transporter family protein [Verrucomicrobiota bacterium]
MLTRRLDKAKQAYRNRDVEAARAAHEAGHEPHDAGEGKYLKSIVYGGLDGIITTFAVVAGVAGAPPPTPLVRVPGLSLLFAAALAPPYGRALGRSVWIPGRRPLSKKKKIMHSCDRFLYRYL